MLTMVKFLSRSASKYVKLIYSSGHPWTLLSLAGSGGVLLVSVGIVSDPVIVLGPGLASPPTMSTLAALRVGSSSVVLGPWVMMTLTW